ncbi:MAG: phospholipase D/Transphosphatidylase [Rhizobacter sp.]|nr:phospholipase D/Transphosphatidylase [Rhizobacter sp.]
MVQAPLAAGGRSEHAGAATIPAMGLFLSVSALVALGVLAVLVFLVFFEPGLAYAIKVDLPAPDSDRFLTLLSAVIDEPLLHVGDFDVLRNGEAFYAAELDAISKARTSIHLEAFIFHATPIGDKFLNALTERARAGVTVRLTVDGFGSMFTPNRFFDRLREAGGLVVWYQPLRWYTLKRYNNRTHRELTIIDGTTAFIGGAGIASAWDTGDKGRQPWRDTMVRVDGRPAAALQTVFVENWLEASGEILAHESVFPASNRFQGPGAQDVPLSVVAASTPSAGRSTRARILFQMLITGARSTIRVNSPYFLPDRAMRGALLGAARRGVKVTVMVPGRYNNHLLARYASRRCYGELIEGGIEIVEYQPGMIHAKILMVDSLWSMVGSTNFDSRSFELNDEVNLAVRDRTIAQRFEQDFERDLEQSVVVDLATWKRRPLVERVMGVVGRVLERQE